MGSNSRCSVYRAYGTGTQVNDLRTPTTLAQNVDYPTLSVGGTSLRTSGIIVPHYGHTMGMVTFVGHYAPEIAPLGGQIRTSS